MANEYHELSSEDPSGTTSQVNSRPASPKLGIRKERGRVRWNDGGEGGIAPKALALQLENASRPQTPPLGSPILQATHSRSNSTTGLLVRHDGGRTPESERLNPFADPVGIEKPLHSPGLKKPRPSMLRNNSAASVVDENNDATHEKAFSALAAQERAQRVATLVGSHSAPTSRHNSFDSEDPDDGPSRPLPVRLDDIQLVNMGHRNYESALIDFSDDDEPGTQIDEKTGLPKVEAHKLEAQKLVRALTRKELSHGALIVPVHPPTDEALASGTATPAEHPDDYVPKPQQYRGGVLSALLKLQNAAQSESSRREAGHGHRRESSAGGASGSVSQGHTPSSSGASTPMKQKHMKWYKHKSHSTQTLENLIQVSNMLSNPAGGKASSGMSETPGTPGTPGGRPTRPGLGRRTSSSRRFDLRLGRPRLEHETIRIRDHIAEILIRQKYIIKLGKGLMLYGAPTHRLEEYLRMTSRVLEIEASFLYIPGCMLISFEDAATHTTEVKLLRTEQAVDLGKLQNIHEIYKEVIHDVIGVEEAILRLDEIAKAAKLYSRRHLILLYGLMSASVGPFAFSARWIDLPICFLLGCLVGTLHQVIAPKSDLYANVFEVFTAIVTSFLARAIGSIPNPSKYKDGPYGNGETYLFCFSAAAQSSIALILPGYIVLCASLELQSRSIVAGSIRMVYAIIYSLFLGFGITIGTVLFGVMYSAATSETTCSNPINKYWYFLFVPFTAFSLCMINQAKWKQLPIMLIISMSGYTANFWTSRYVSNAQLSNTVGAFVVGLLGNLHSRLRHGLAVANMLPAIFVQVPSGLAAGGSLLAGLTSANSITNSTTGYYPNGTIAVNGTSSISVTEIAGDPSTVVLNVGYSVCFLLVLIPTKC